jgi:hypothetical protein
MTEATAAEIGLRTIEVNGQTKYAISFPLTDENGKALLDKNGKPRVTNLIGDTVEDVVRKQSESMLEVSRALERSTKRFETLSGRTPAPATPRAEIKATALTAEESVQVGLDAQDPRKAAAAIARVVESVVPVKEITAEVQRTSQSIDLEQRKRIAREFIAQNADSYLPVEANNAMLNAYLIKHGLAFTVDNLEFASAACAPQLARATPRPNNDPPPSHQNDPPQNDPPNSGAPPSPQRRTPVGGIRNSQVSDRPGSGDVILTKKQAYDMLRNDRKKFETWMQDPVKNQILNRALASRD